MSFTDIILLPKNYKDLLLGDDFENNNSKVSEFKRRTNLKHNRKFHNRNSYCGSCGNQFNKIIEMNKHIRERHEIVPVYTFSNRAFCYNSVYVSYMCINSTFFR